MTRDEAEGDITHFIDVSRVLNGTAFAIFGKQWPGHATIKWEIRL